MKLVDIRTGERRPTLGVAGTMSFYEERQLRSIGGSRCRAKAELNEPFNQVAHYSIPLPMARRLFNRSADPTKWSQPNFMLKWEHALGQQFADLHVTQRAYDLYQKWLAAEKEIGEIKRNNEDVINSILGRHNINGNFFVREPKPHQKAGLAFFLVSYEFGAGHVMFFDEMRTGKTKQTIDIARFLLREKEIRNVLVVCPNSIKRVWHNELLKDAPDYAWITAIVQGTKAKRQALWNEGFFFYVVNYESLRNDEVEIQDWQDRREGKWLMIVDEAHKLKNVAALQTKVILGTAREHKGLQPDYSVFLTGTPVANTPIDVWSTCNFACPGILEENIGFFKNKFTISEGRSGYGKIVGYQRLDEIRWRLARISMRRRRKDVMFDESVTMERYGTLQGEQKKAYESMRDTLYAEVVGLDGEPTAVQARNHLAKMIRLQQITSGYVSPKPSITGWFKDYGWKIKELDDLLADYIEDFGKIVIWSRFVPVLMHLLERYRKYNALICKGGMGNEAIDNMYKFQQDPKHKVMLSQFQTSEGKGFQPATTAVFLDKWLSPYLNKQAADRITGIENPVTTCLIPFITEGTIDERIEFLLKEKRDWGDAVTGDTRQNEVRLPNLDKATLLYLLANPEEAREYEAEFGREKQLEIKGV